MGQLERAKKTNQWAVSSWSAEVSAFNLLTPTPTRPCSRSAEVKAGEEGNREGGGGGGGKERARRWGGKLMSLFFLFLFPLIKMGKILPSSFFTSFHYLYFHRFWWFRKTLVTVLWFLFTSLCLEQIFSLNAPFKKIVREKERKKSRQLSESIP